MIQVPCDREKISLALPSAIADRARIITSEKHASAAITASTVEQSLLQPIGTSPLTELAKGKTSACIVVSDITRPVPNKLLLPSLLAALERAGVPRTTITLLIATGMHRPNLGQELEELVGAEIVANYRVLNHDCHDRNSLRQVLTIDGAAIEINSAYLDADLKILTGLIEPHPFAGYSGGGKSILPGISSFETMKFMHSYALVEHPQVATARVEDNPFRRHINAVSAAAGVDFILNVIVDDDKKPIALFSGDVEAAFNAGCRQAEKNTIVHVGTPADVVVTSGGGAPLDTTLYQSTKGLLAAKDIIRPGGTILLIAGCREGLGSESYCDIIRSAAASPAEFRSRYSNPENFVIDQWGAQVYFQTLERAGRILLYSPHLSQRQIDPFGMTLVEDLDKTISEICADNRSICVVPEGPYVDCVL